MKKIYQTLMLLVLITLIFSGCETLLIGDIAGYAGGKALNSIAEQKATIDTYGKLVIIESSMYKIDTILNDNNKIIVIEGKLKFTKAPKNFVFVDVRFYKFYYKFYNEKAKQINNMLEYPIFDSDVNRQSLEVNKDYNFKVEFYMPSNQWEIISSYQFININNPFND